MSPIDAVDIARAKADALFLGERLQPVLTAFDVSRKARALMRLWGRAFIIAYIIGEISRNVAFLNLDIFLEHISENKDTGGIRGFFLTALNIAFVLGPIIAGLLIKNTFDSGVVYLWGFVISLFVILLSIKHFKNFKDTKYNQTHLWHSLREVKQKPNLNRIFMSSFILQFFFSWMIIYTPIFLHNYIGFTLSEIAIIIGIALVPFVILEIPLGKIADEKLGEKEILTTGFIITAFFTVIMAFVNIKSFWLWVAILFMTRVGASMIEIMTETYLFKKVDAENINIMGLFRAIRPASYVVSPILASIILLYFSINYLFVILGLVLITGIGYSLRLDDTK
jgi:MFS family permease